ncbi:ubiquinol-cytochrome C reductase complex subunit oxen [Rhynchophorus ferrugineus]|uniref:ubiquinol-cytochrome C reductase complex subunit oxen n=1 Tax=Rhynchophorus ferrugineus TaxID=354439 RepID=UPI003FCEE27F
MSVQSTIYNTVFKRTSTFALACVASAFFFERGFDLACDTIFNRINEGKLWKDIKEKYAQ